MTRGSRRRSFLQATRMVGRPGQKCMTSEIHYNRSETLAYTIVNTRTYLLLNVVKRVRRVDGEADKDNMRIGVAERAETIVILLTSGIPKRKLDVLAVYLDVGDVVLEHRRDVNLRDMSQEKGFVKRRSNCD
jgi:hypothetical protein